MWDDNTITKTVNFASDKAKGFVTYKANIYYDERFLDNSLPEGFGFEESMNAGEVSGSYARGYRISTDGTYGVGIIRERVNDRFVLSAPCDPSKTALSMKVFSDYLSDNSSGRHLLDCPTETIQHGFNIG